RIRNDEPVIAVNEPQLGEREQQRVRCLRIKLTEVDLPILHFPKTRIRHSSECRCGRNERDGLLWLLCWSSSVVVQRDRCVQIELEGIPVEAAFVIVRRIEHEL